MQNIITKTGIADADIDADADELVRCTFVSLVVHIDRKIFADMQ